jgi:hypothetical protein
MLHTTRFSNFAFMGQAKQQLWNTLGLASGNSPTSPMMGMVGNMIPDNPDVIENHAMQLKQFKDRYLPRVSNTPGQYLRGVQEDIGAGVGLGSVVKGAALRTTNVPTSSKYVRGTQLKQRGVQILSSPVEQRQAANRFLLGTAGTVGGLGALGAGAGLALRKLNELPDSSQNIENQPIVSA